MEVAAPLDEIVQHISVVQADLLITLLCTIVSIVVQEFRSRNMPLQLAISLRELLTQSIPVAQPETLQFITTALDHVLPDLGQTADDTTDDDDSQSSCSLGDTKENLQGRGESTASVCERLGYAIDGLFEMSHVLHEELARITDLCPCIGCSKFPFRGI